MIACPWCATIVDRGHCTSCARPLEAGWKVCPWCRTTPAAKATTGAHEVRVPRVLVVSDEAVVHSFVRSAVGSTIDVDVAPTADDALTAVWDGEYDGVVVHDQLPGIGGAELLRMLRNGSRTAALPLMLVGDLEGAEVSAASAAEHGVDEVLPLTATATAVRKGLTLLIERSPHAPTWRGTPAKKAGATDTADVTEVAVPAKNRRVRAVAVPAERRGRQSTSRASNSPS